MAGMAGRRSGRNGSSAPKTTFAENKVRYVGNHACAEFVEFGGSGGVPMPSSKEYWLHAQQCLELAKEAEDFYVKSALIELAEKFKKQAEKIRDR